MLWKVRSSSLAAGPAPQLRSGLRCPCHTIRTVDPKDELFMHASTGSCASGPAEARWAKSHLVVARETTPVVNLPSDEIVAVPFGSTAMLYPPTLVEPESSNTALAAVVGKRAFAAAPLAGGEACTIRLNKAAIIPF